MLYVEECVYKAKLMLSWGYLGGALGSLGHTLGLYWGMSGPFWGHIGRSLAVLGHTVWFSA